MATEAAVSVPPLPLQLCRHSTFLCLSILWILDTLHPEYNTSQTASSGYWIHYTLNTTLPRQHPLDTGSTPEYNTSHPLDTGYTTP
ncbi:hypothetical protein J6590_019801 [Homalodisca vitripennis]|nr:hypothetical protein J6590_019801 [Homalodisca vitripennis]